MKLMLLLIEICVVPARSLHYKKCFRYFRPNLSLIKTQENNTNIPTCKLSKCFRKSLSVSLLFSCGLETNTKWDQSRILALSFAFAIL
jgi:hypothetical protein